MQHGWLSMVLWQVFVTTAHITIIRAMEEDTPFKEFINNVEHLVLDIEDEALRLSIQVYEQIADTMTPQLRQAATPLMENYVEMVKHALAVNSSYGEKRIVFRHFRINNWKIERLRSSLAPDMPQFQFEVISPEFYFHGRNLTKFDNLYLRFMKEFQQISQKLWDCLSENVVENQQEMLEILDEISNEKNLAEKDKLYDEFIETFLFKSEKDRLETRELE
ncbi:uncharacterized protein LOC142226955 isoform X1 [Haematobia irritans]|uniref:uncharacterized protein LOC142226955 isoform X1 n=1 Tax=Haematobia irritans TaxID=7368 RepID=UPI003F5015B8